MGPVLRLRHALQASLLGLAAWLGPLSAAAQDLPRVSVSRPLLVEGLTMDPHVPDLLGLSRVRFQGLIAVELANVGYRLAEPQRNEPALPLVLAGSVKEEICDDVAPSQCRIAIQWELQEPNGVVVYRTLTRAVEQQPTLERLRRALVEGALRSLLGRRRFTLRLVDPNGSVAPLRSLGFEQCRRESLRLPGASRAALAGLVIVESGSNVAAGAILSADGLILTSAAGLVPGAPLRVRFSARQVVPARVVASAKEPGVVLLRTDAHTASTCLGLRDEPLAPGVTVFGVSSAPEEGSALSLAASAVAAASSEPGRTEWEVERRVAVVRGAPLVDEDSRLAALVVAPSERHGLAPVLDIRAALAALGLEPASITDPRLLDGAPTAPTDLGYVRDADDPPFELTRHYTFGTGPTAAKLRTVGLVTAGIGGAGVIATWLQFRGKNDVSPHERSRLIVFNDVSWAVFALGAAGIGVSFALPQPHDVVEGHGSARLHVSLAVAANGVGASGEF